jgi:hypothetical protein
LGSQRKYNLDCSSQQFNNSTGHSPFNDAADIIQRAASGALNARSAKKGLSHHEEQRI